MQNKLLVTCFIVMLSALNVCAQKATRLGMASANAVLSSHGTVQARISFGNSFTGLCSKPEVAWFGFLPLTSAPDPSSAAEPRQQSLKVFPLPATNILRASVPEWFMQNEVRFRLVDACGSSVYSIQGVFTLFALSVAEIPSGTYTLILEANGTCFAAPVVVLH